MIYLWIILGLLYIVIGIVLAYYLNKRIDLNQTGDRLYTRLTMIMSVISFVGMLFMATTVFMNGYLLEDTKAAMIAQAEGIAPIVPTLEVISIDSASIITSSWLIVGLETDEQNNISKPRTFPIRFIVRNMGQEKTNDVRFTLSDVDNNFHEKNTVEFFDPLESKIVSIEIRSNNCNSGDLMDFNNDFENCTTNMLGGFHNWNLTVDCWGCKERYSCYTFSTCLYNNSEGKENCELQYDEDKLGLKKVECVESYDEK